MIYLDNNATTPVDPAALQAMLPFFEDHFANPSGAYAASRTCAKAITTAREQVATLLGCTDSEVVFTSGGTESDITALHSATHSFPERKHIVTLSLIHI